MRALTVSPDERAHLKPLTSLRFVAALLVFLAHFPPAQFANRLSFGSAGVGFFFVLSGFILTYTYQRAFADQFKASVAWKFHVARIARIFPMHLATMTLCLAWFIPFGAPEWNITTPVGRMAATVAQVLLLQSWSPNPGLYEGVNVVSWSISVEAFFYALFPFMVFLMMRTLGKARGDIILATGGMIWLLEIATLAPLKPNPILAWALYVFPPLRLVDFVAGMLVALVFLRVDAVKAPSHSLVEFGAVGVVIAAIVWAAHAPASLRYGTALIPFWALLVYVFAWQAGNISKLLSNPWCVRLGEISFAFYMVHYVVLIAEDRIIGWSHPILSFCAGIAVTLAMSLALFNWIETPMRRWIRRTLSPRDTASW